MALKGIKVLELAGLAPGPLCGMVLSDFGASVIFVDKVGPKLDFKFLSEGKSTVNVDLKNSKGKEFFRRMVTQSDVLIEPFRAGVMEKLNLGPDVLLKDNPRLVYARLTGFGQSGPFSPKAGHDINFLSLSGIVMALYEREKSGLGQVVDASMVEGAAYVGSWFFRSRSGGLLWGQPRGKNPLDGGAFFYDTYETKDGKWMAVGAIEPQFYSALLSKLNISEDSLPQSTDFEAGHNVLSAKFIEKTLKEWCETFDGNNECVTPVLSLEEAANHPHSVARNSFAQLGDQIIPNPSPRLSRTPPVSSALRNHSEEEVVKSFVSSLGFSESDISELIFEGVIELAFRPCKM